jgi:hypothetical protein
MKFKTQDVADLLPVDDPNGALVPLVVSGTLLDGTAFTSSSDCVRLVPPGTPPGLVAVQSNAAEAWIDVAPLDDQLDGGGFTSFERAYLQSTEMTLTASPTHEGQAFLGWYIDGGPLIEDVTVSLVVVSTEHSLEAVYVPEPESWMMLIAGAAFLGLLYRLRVLGLRLG